MLKVIYLPPFKETNITNTLYSIINSALLNTKSCLTYLMNLKIKKQKISLTICIGQRSLELRMRKIRIIFKIRRDGVSKCNR